MKRCVLILVLGLNYFAYSAFGQAKIESENNQKPQAELFDNFGNISSEERSARIDGLIQKVNTAKNNKGAIIIFCGKVCQYGELEAHIRGINLKLNARDVDKTDYPIIIGGYRNKTSTELWFIPGNACPPIPKSDFKIEDVIFKGIHKRKIVYYDCC